MEVVNLVSQVLKVLSKFFNHLNAVHFFTFLIS
jgi:hypothetical protein